MSSLASQSLARLHQDEAGQGLVEYLMILALVGFASTAGIGTLASALNSGFSATGSVFGSYI
jgi:Flp pilus assembly pilin Flp